MTRLQARITYDIGAFERSIDIAISAGINMAIPPCQHIDIDILFANPAVVLQKADGAIVVPANGGVILADTILEASATPTHNPRGSRWATFTERRAGEATPVLFPRPPGAQFVEVYWDQSNPVFPLFWTIQGGTSGADLLGEINAEPGTKQSPKLSVPGSANGFIIPAGQFVDILAVWRIEV